MSEINEKVIILNEKIEILKEEISQIKNKINNKAKKNKKKKIYTFFIALFSLLFVIYLYGSLSIGMKLEYYFILLVFGVLAFVFLKLNKNIKFTNKNKLNKKLNKLEKELEEIKNKKKEILDKNIY